MLGFTAVACFFLFGHHFDYQVLLTTAFRISTILENAIGWSARHMNIARKRPSSTPLVIVIMPPWLDHNAHGGHDAEASATEPSTSTVATALLCFIYVVPSPRAWIRHLLQVAPLNSRMHHIPKQSITILRNFDSHTADLRT